MHTVNQNGFFEKAQNVQQRKENISITENGAVGYRSTGKSLLDMNFSIPKFRDMPENEICEMWEKAYFEDPLLALRWLFYVRDVRGGLGERRLFRVIIKSIANKCPSLIRELMRSVDSDTTFGGVFPIYGRWDDLLTLMDTDLKNNICLTITRQLVDDINNMRNNQPVSLLAKWLPSISTKSSKREARKLCKKLGMQESYYRKILSKLRKYIKVTEVYMSSGQWDEIEYDHVPGRASMIYANAFRRHDGERYSDFINQVNEGKMKINAATVFPHEIVHRMKDAMNTSRWSNSYNIDTTDQLEALWKNLPNTVKGDNGGTIVVRDGSGSMSSHYIPKSNITVMDVGDALSIYFAEHLKGEFHNKVITFSSHPQFIQFDSESTLESKLRTLMKYTEVSNTNIEAVFDLILETALTYNMKQEEIPANILIISDMEFDSCAESRSYTGRTIPPALFDHIKKKYEDNGYKIPRIVFWNVASRSGTIPMVENDLGVALVSGYSVNNANMVMSGKIDPYECLVEQLMNPRYDRVVELLKYLKP